MQYFDDWPKKRQRFEALWQREIIDRCCVRVVAYKNDPYMQTPFPEKLEDQMAYWLDGEKYLQRELKRIENTCFLGEAFPQIFSNFGAAGHAAFFKGVKISFDQSIWIHPKVIAKPDEEVLVEYDQNSLMLKKNYQIIQYLTEQSRGRYFVSLPDISGNLDALAHIRGNDVLLMDMVQQEKNIRDALNEIMRIWKIIITDIYNMTMTLNDGGSTIGWLDTWAPGLHAQIQSDISVMISPKMYRTYVMPELIEQCEFITFPLYHLDGIEQLRHLDQLLSLEKLKMIQWTNVAGQPSPVEYIPIFQKIQSAGKRLLIRISDIREIESLLTSLSSRGLYLYIDFILDTLDEAKQVLRLVEKLTHD